MSRREYWLVTTQHLGSGLLFKDDNDFTVGMNYVAVQAHRCGVGVLAFVLMSNHMHFVLQCPREVVMLFAECLKREYSKYLNRKYRDVEILRRNKFKVDSLPESGEVLERAIAYVHMNPVAANICALPQEYPWGTGGVFYSLNQLTDCTLTGTMSSRARYRALHTKAEVPGSWALSPKGYILPGSYVDVDLVENIFQSPKRMNYFLHTSSKAQKRMDREKDGLPAFKDQVILAALPDLCRSLFGKMSVGVLRPEEQVELMRQVRYRFSAGAGQISRVMGVRREQVESGLDSM